MTYIEVNNLVKIYRAGKLEVQALRGLHLSVERGEFIAIVGPSGSGKTTLLNIIGGLDDVTAGTTEVAGHRINDLTEKGLVEFRRSVVGHVFQTLNLIPTLTAEENIGLPMIAAKVPKKDRTNRITELTEILGIHERVGHKPGELSGGEQQRVAIAAALANDPPIILADEPTGELDSENAQIIVDYLKKIHQELGKTILMVTHDPAIARQTQRILRIEDGVIKGEFLPSSLSENASAITYVDQIRGRIDALTTQINELEIKYKGDDLTVDQFVEERAKLVNSRRALKDELYRMGA